MVRTAPFAVALALSVSLAACTSESTTRTSPGTARTTAETAAVKATGPMSPDATQMALAEAVAGAWRDPANRARDGYRHPLQTLQFFAVKPGDTVIEITPGNGWYSEILAPYVAGSGRYLAALPDPMAAPAGKVRDGRMTDKTALETKYASDTAHYARAAVIGYDPSAPVFGGAGTANVVLTFRNVHNWRMSGLAEGMFKGFYDVLKPGGTLGVVEHRAAADVATDDRSGYVGEAQVIAMAEAAGFRLDAKSEVNANARDSKSHPNGVWTLPPVNDHDAGDNAKYQAIGESDRMTLRFVKPAA